ncbi:PP2C family protein-serine/threonine phosphatase [Kineococcus aurantiacus]|uniref:Sigma-B regulation protein RsbU (Phosphoserine phosphatase) n=1 Tax=Kineococcus aurantiacus TaxID=37633 RepID=A0A7Y9DPW4_9ACTN|nr:SpoIIE family protein phosphatase [Kineococcus aurantiacus]NYD24523.1 sigma-B regulation protein RsbU (phosphoserine phosphatase) [Kineococcus aurantiacus]
MSVARRGAPHARPRPTGPLRLLPTRWSLARWSLTRLVLVASAVALVVVLATGALLLSSTQGVSVARSRQSAAQDARQSLAQLTTSYVDQETGLRGYLVNGDPRLLEPLNTAQTTLPRLEREVRRSAAALGARAGLVDAPMAAHDVWARYAAVQRQRVLDGDRAGATELSETLRGKGLFDRVRAGSAALDGWLAREEAQEQHRVRALQRRLQVVLVVAVAALAVALVAGFLVLWRGVTTPLARLARASRAVADGDLAAELPAGGTTEVQALAGGVAAMRDRLTADLWRTRRALEALAQGDPALDALQRDLLGPGQGESWAPSGAGPALPLRWPDLDVQVRVEPAEGVLAGDWCDVFEVGATRVAVVVGDVAGHGPVSAVFAYRLKHVLRTALTLVPSPGEALGAVARRLSGVDAELFATLVVAVVDRAAGQLTCVNAGHPAGLLTAADPAVAAPVAAPVVAPVVAPGARPGQERHVLLEQPGAGDGPGGTGWWRELPATGPILSPVLPDAQWSEVVLPFPPGQQLLLFTDGVLETRDRQGREFGPEGVLRAVRDSHRQRSGRVVDAVEAAAVRHGDFAARVDDHTLLSLTRRRAGDG